MADTSVSRFFGDAQRTLCLTPPMILELEKQTGAGIGSLFRRMLAGEFHHGDMVQTIRLALIGGGATPKDAASLTATYATERPIGEVYPLAVEILDALYSGTPAEKFDVDKLRADIAEAFESGAE
ncbi:gene transfer agent family protein [Terrihabitans rhizophilus]|uniref:Gene transfer agent family protein n=1 Tax=Terrihabitans rhizophilus TaxID=3092662 RepID=A0ABU4RQP8_9HYPH|nr:gene transfer agent family protein [Terrihabitans sp. PJ23]MDX6806424.1 gene transfer agent family protein [Terrihabitans sp. PJ23]